MYFVLIDDIEGSSRHYPSGDLLSNSEFRELVFECGVVSAHCFLTLDGALEWNRSQDCTCA